MLTRDKKLEGGVTGQRGVEFFPIQFLSRVNRLTHDTDIAILSVCHCLSVSARHVPVFYGKHIVIVFTALCYA